MDDKRVNIDDDQIIKRLDKIIFLLESQRVHPAQNEPKKSEMNICNCNDPRDTSGGYWCPVHGNCFL